MRIFFFYVYVHMSVRGTSIRTANETHGSVGKGARAREYEMKINNDGRVRCSSPYFLYRWITMWISVSQTNERTSLEVRWPSSKGKGVYQRIPGSKNPVMDLKVLEPKYPHKMNIFTVIFTDQNVFIGWKTSGNRDQVHRVHLIRLK